MPKDNVNEGSTAWLTVTFLDKNKEPEAPTTIFYRIDCLTTATAIKAETPVTPAASSVEIELTVMDNRIVKQSNKYEKRLVTVSCTYGVDEAMPEEY